LSGRWSSGEAQVVIESLALLHGSLPRRALAMVLEWAAIHREELRANWELAREGKPLSRIRGLE
jgi:hypothetical protein